MFRSCGFGDGSAQKARVRLEVHPKLVGSDLLIFPGFPPPCDPCAILLWASLDLPSLRRVPPATTTRKIVPSDFLFAESHHSSRPVRAITTSLAIQTGTNRKMAAIGSLIFCTACGNLLPASRGSDKNILKCDCCGSENQGMQRAKMVKIDSQTDRCTALSRSPSENDHNHDKALRLSLPPATEALHCSDGRKAQGANGKDRCQYRLSQVRHPRSPLL